LKGNDGSVNSYLVALQLKQQLLYRRTSGVTFENRDKNTAVIERRTEFGLELLAGNQGLLFQGGSVQAQIAITANTQAGVLAAKLIVNTVYSLQRGEYSPEGEADIAEVKTVAVEDWLASLELAPGTKAKIRNIMSGLFNHAMRYEWTERNPIQLVRQSAKRLRVPDVLDVVEMKRLLTELEQPVLAMMCLDAATGLRRGELLGLKWSDIDFERLEISLNRVVVRQVIGGLKTEASRKPLSMEPALADLLLDWKSQSAYNGQDDWVFASPVMNGTQPLWPENILRRYVRPAAARAGITKRISFHTFRHSLATLMKANGEDVKTVQEILSHPNSRITLDIYAQAVTPAKRRAQGKVLEMILPSALQAAQTAEKGTATA